MAHQKGPHGTFKAPKTGLGDAGGPICQIFYSDIINVIYIYIIYISAIIIIIVIVIMIIVMMMIIIIIVIYICTPPKGWIVVRI